MPAVSELVEPLVAEPPTNATGAPKFAPSILNCTEPPVGLPVPAPVPTTVAVKLMLSPNVDGFKLDETVVSVLRLLIVNVPVPELALNPAPGVYDAWIVYGPAFVPGGSK